MKLCLLLFISCLAFAENQPGMFPDPVQTPGAFDPKTTKEMVCAPRPSFTNLRRDVSPSEKAKVFQNYKLSGSLGSGYEVDHFIPLSLGGTNEFKNLWPISVSFLKEKQSVEKELLRRVCKGKLSLNSAQDILRTNWHDFFLQIKKGK